MSTPMTEVVGSAAPAADEQDDHSHGASDKQYFKIFWVLVVLTALEVSTEWWTDWFGEGSRKVAVPLLIFLMIVKFFLVALYFMHLKFDNAMLRRIFWFGTIVAMAVYGGALTSMNFWEDSGTTRFNDPPSASSSRPGGSEAEVAPGAGSGTTETDGG